MEEVRKMVDDACDYLKVMITELNKLDKPVSDTFEGNLCALCATLIDLTIATNKKEN